MALIVINASVCAALYLGVLLFYLTNRTPFLWFVRQRLKGSISSSMAEDLMKRPGFVSAVISRRPNQEGVKLVSTMSHAELAENALIVTIDGFAPKRISLQEPGPIANLFGDSSAEQIPFHSFEVQRHCILLFDETNDERLLRVFWAAYEEWTGSFKMSFLEPYSWHDHATAARLSNLHGILLVLNKRGLLSPERFREIVNLMIVHGEFLGGEKIYDPVTNHGLIVDKWLLGVALKLKDIPQSERWARTAIHRSLGRIDHYISDDGVPLEPATTYWFLILWLLNGIAEMSERGGFPVDAKVKAKLQRCKQFLKDINIQGLYQRIGDSSGGHDIGFDPVEVQRPDGYHLYVYDSGLLYLNAVKDGKIASQVLFNVQNPKPYVHRHEDALALNLYHEGTFWINSPGSYSAEKTPTARFVKSFGNQSITYNRTKGYSHECSITDLTVDTNGFRVAGTVKTNGEVLVRRTVELDLQTETLCVSDATASSDVAVSQFILPPESDVILNGQEGARITNRGNELLLETSVSPSVSEAKISYSRNQLEDTKMLVFAAQEVSVRFRLGHGLSTLSAPNAGTAYPYRKRKNYRPHRGPRLAARLHKKRRGQIAILLAMELLAFSTILLALS